MLDLVEEVTVFVVLSMVWPIEELRSPTTDIFASVCGILGYAGRGSKIKKCKLLGSRIDRKCFSDQLWKEQLQIVSKRTDVWESRKLAVCLQQHMRTQCMGLHDLVGS